MTADPAAAPEPRFRQGSRHDDGRAGPDASDAVAILDVDLRDPHELMPPVVLARREGADLEVMRRGTRVGESLGERVGAHPFQRALTRIAGPDLEALLARAAPKRLMALARMAYVQAQRPRLLMVMCLIGTALSVFYPSDLLSYRDTPRSEHALVTGTEQYGRFINTIAQLALPIVKRDPIGMMQNLYIGFAGTLMTHGLKRALDPVTVQGVRLGERPYGGRHNMPSGHASLASSAVYFVGRRYGWWHLFYLVPVLLLTMFARVELDAHTGSAVIAGALIGIFSAALFTGKYRS
ncbi:lipid A 1-phosphatase LpxE [Luteimonas sp. RD2P54]|uniref:Lipid A 1-phosphatase LpxE n=1 Tax=Luteimonas endophytica TaxID=3042023 RepID=A0ABT6J8K6_9GAMM|nr:lipid A 1-phosphatase LpxE [Luteimonas endophytica]MDH5822508.1 lipid A 1-phosphatase LpxE [Luteimonas endophytica]